MLLADTVEDFYLFDMADVLFQRQRIHLNASGARETHSPSGILATGTGGAGRGEDKEVGVVAEAVTTRGMW